MKAARAAMLGGLLSVACGRQDLDLLVKAQAADPCVDFVDESDCHAAAALGCSFRPNTQGCLSTDPSCQPGECRSGDPFVRRVERSFFLNGAPFRFVGVSSWALLQPSPCATVKAAEREAWVEKAYDGLVPARAKVARFFAFQSSAGPSATDFTLFDAAVRGARRAGVRLQFVLESSDGGCSLGAKHDDAWYQNGYTSPDGNDPLSYQDWIESVANRYHDEPTVLGYALIQGLHGAEPSTISSFVTKVGQRLHGLARNQLVSLDLDWGIGNDGGVAYREIEELPVVDFVDLDDYTFKYPAQPLDPTLLGVLGEIPKPAVVGEGAFVLEGSAEAAFKARAEAAASRAREWRGWGLSGALFWAYQPDWSSVSEEFDARPADPMLQADGVVANAPW